MSWCETEWVKDGDKTETSSASADKLSVDYRCHSQLIQDRQITRIHSNWWPVNNTLVWFLLLWTYQKPTWGGKKLYSFYIPKSQIRPRPTGTFLCDPLRIVRNILCSTSYCFWKGTPGSSIKASKHVRNWWKYSRSYWTYTRDMCKPLNIQIQQIYS